MAQGLFDKPVTLNVKNLPVQEALAQFGKKNDLKLAYSGHFFTENKKVTLKAKAKPAHWVLDRLLAGTGVGYKELGGQVVLYLLPAGAIIFTPNVTPNS